jgi:predicted DNA-binding transcriptional regulator YafY
VKVTYLRYQKKHDQVIPVRPYLLKEYRGRWYLLGLADGYKQPISLGLDRMRGIQVTGKRFPSEARARVETFYAPVIGVDATPGKAERVVLRFTALQGKYVKALPMHPSQLVLKDDADALVVSLHVMPNYELRQELLGLGATVKVLEPKWLAREIREEHRKAAR